MERFSGPPCPLVRVQYPALSTEPLETPVQLYCTVTPAGSNVPDQGAEPVTASACTSVGQKKPLNHFLVCRLNAGTWVQLLIPTGSPTLISITWKYTPGEKEIGRAHV